MNDIATKLTHVYDNQQKIHDNAYLSTSKLISRTITNINDPEITEVGAYAFARCLDLEFVNFPAVTTLQSYAFNYCPGLQRIDLPSVEIIGTYVFQSCGYLTALILRNDKVCVLNDRYAFGSTPITSNKTGFIYVPASLIDEYKAATNWSSVASQFRALEDYTVDGTTTGALDPNKI